MEYIDMVKITAICTALTTVLVVILSVNVSRLRVLHKVSLGDGGHADLNRAIRTHGNTIENAPLVLVLLLLCELSGLGVVMLWTLGGMFVISRYFYAWALTKRSFSRVRQISSSLSLLVMLILAISLFVKVT